MDKIPIARARRYLARVVAETDQKPSAIAEKAGLKNTTITRPLSPGYKGEFMRLETLRKIAAVTRVPLAPDIEVPDEDRPDHLELALRIVDAAPGLRPENRAGYVRQVVSMLDAAVPLHRKPVGKR